MLNVEKRPAPRLSRVKGVAGVCTSQALWVHLDDDDATHDIVQYINDHFSPGLSYSSIPMGLGISRNIHEDATSSPDELLSVCAELCVALSSTKGLERESAHFESHAEEFMKLKARSTEPE